MLFFVLALLCSGFFRTSTMKIKSFVNDILHTAIVKVSFKIVLIFNEIPVKSSHRQTFFLVRRHRLSICFFLSSFRFEITLIRSIIIGVSTERPNDQTIHQYSLIFTFLNYIATVLFTKMQVNETIGLILKCIEIYSIGCCMFQNL